MARSRSHSRRGYSDTVRRGCNPLTVCCRCTFGGPTVQFILHLFIPFLISIICFLAGFWLIPVWTLNNGNNNKMKLAAQGYGINGQDSGTRQFLYKTPNSAVNGIPLLLLLHLILSVLLITYLIFTISVCIYAAQRRKSDLNARQAWAKVIRQPKGWERALCLLLWLATLALLVFDNIVWGLARGRGDDLNPDVLGYFVNIVGLLLFVFWTILLAATAHDVKKENKYEERNGRRRTEKVYVDGKIKSIYV